ncbi:MAG TPA: CoA-binding protein [Acidimicrobiales bacterium]|jgi:predicted CoA-binding protein|nr:CoA-binding protein [Acidimicrobiales bacterium]
MADPDTIKADIIKAVLALHTWAVVGCSPDPRRASHDVAGFLHGKGHRVIPVHPDWGYPTLADIPASEGVEVVDVFRRSEEAGRHIDEAVEIGAKAVWTQLGVVDRAAARRAEAAGLLVVMDHCPKIEYPRHGQ